MTSNQKWRQNHPDAVRAHRQIAKAVKNGTLVPQPCQHCGHQKTHAHHDDYGKPLEIEWLCNTCHRDVHTEKSGKVKRDKGWKKEYFRQRYAESSYHQEVQMRRAAKQQARAVLVEKAQCLRKHGLTYKEIGEALKRTKSTIYKWLNDVKYV